MAPAPTGDARLAETSKEDPDDHKAIAASSESVELSVAEPTAEDAVPMKPSIDADASCFSQFFFNFMSDLIELGSVKVLQLSDMAGSAEDDKSEHCYEIFMEDWDRQRGEYGEDASLFLALLRASSIMKYVLASLALGLNFVSQFASVFALRSVLQHLEGKSIQEDWVLYLLCCVMFVLGWLPEPPVPGAAGPCCVDFARPGRLYHGTMHRRSRVSPASVQR